MRLVWLVGLMTASVIPAAAALPSGVFDHNSCQPSFDAPIAQNLLWTIQNPTPSVREPQKPTHELNTLNDIFAALRRCYVPPSIDQARPGMQITVQFAFTRAGDILGKPRITYETQGISPEHQSAYRMAVAAALARCTPLSFSKSLGNAIAGRIFAIRFVDERQLKRTERTQ